MVTEGNWGLAMDCAGPDTDVHQSTAPKHVPVCTVFTTTPLTTFQGARPLVI